MDAPMKILVAAALMAANPSERVVRLDDPAIYLPPALGKQVNVRFSERFAAGRLDRSDFDGVVLTELRDGKVCLLDREAGLESGQPALRDLEHGPAGDVCVALADVSVRFTPQEVAEAPPMPFYSTDHASCQWVWKTGGGIGVWTEDCTFETGHWAVNFDLASGSFALSVDDGDPFPVLRIFEKKTDDWSGVLLAELRKAGLVPDDDECRFEEAHNTQKIRGWTFWEIVPTGARKKAFEATPTDEVPQPPCGEVGMAADSISFFMIPDARPDRVIHVNLGQDGTLIDPFTIVVP